MPLGSTVAFRPMRSATMFTELSIRPVKRACVHKIRTNFRLVGYSEVGPRERTGKQRRKHRMATFHCIRFSPDISRVAMADAMRKASRLCFSFFESEGQEDF